MFVDIISGNNLQSYNVWLAQKIGLNNAIYLNVLVDLFQKAGQTNSIIPDDYFWVDREYVTARTTFSIEDQLKIEDTLSSMGFLYWSEDKKYVRIDMNTLMGISKTVNEDIIDCFNRVKTKASKVSRKESILRAVQRNINADYPGNIKEALKEWLNTLMTKYGFVNNAMLNQAEEKLTPIIYSDIPKALELIQIATVQGYRDFTWAFVRYDELHKNDSVKTNITTSSQALSNDFF